MSESVQMYTIYKNPKDYPDKFVARVFDIHLTGVWVTDEVIVRDSYEELVKHIPGWKIKIPRAEIDDPCILETWL